MKTRRLVVCALSSAMLLGCAKDPGAGTQTSAMSGSATSATMSGPTAIATASAPTAASVAPAEMAGALSVDTLPGKCDEQNKGGAAKIVATQAGADVKVALTNYTTYCTSDAKYSVTKDGDTIHITGSKPSAVSRCACAHDMTFTVHGAAVGTYKISVEETPYTTDGGVKQIASGSITKN